LPVALGEFADVAMLHILDAAVVHDLADLSETFAARQTFHFRGELEAADHRHVGVEGRILWPVAETATHLQRLIKDIVAGDACRATGRRHEAGESAHGCSLPRPVWPEEPENFPLFHNE